MALGVVFVCIGCGGSTQAPQWPSATDVEKMQKRKDALVMDCLRRISYARQFSALYTNFYASLNEIPDRQLARFSMEGVIYARYEITMRVRIWIDEEMTIVRSNSAPEFVINEVKEVQQLPRGRIALIYDTNGCRRFGPTEWQRLFASNGDLSVLGLHRTEPVPGMAAHWKAAKQERHY